MNVVKVLFSPKYLAFTNVGLGLTFLTLGDCTQQHLEKWYARYERKREAERYKLQTAVDQLTIANRPRPVEADDWQFDYKRSECMLKTGVPFGVVGHYWYKFLDTKFPGIDKRTLFKKVLAEMAAGPPFVLQSFLVVGFFEGKDLRTSWKNFQENLLLVCLVDWGVYIPLQYLNFRYISPRYRFLFVACVTLVYDTFLSFVLHKDDKVKVKPKVNELTAR